MDFTELGPFCATAETFWRNNTMPDGDQVILVEAMSQDLRVTLRNLTFANALRRFLPARLVVYTGADADWQRILWTYFDAEVLTRLSEAYGATDVFDIHALVDDLIGDEPPAEFAIAGRTFMAKDLRTGIAADALDEMVHATAARVYQAPRIDPVERRSSRYQHIRDRTEKFSQVYDAMFAGLDPVAVVTSHVDYNHWGLAVESAQRFGVPVVHVQSTGSFKAYALFPEKRRGGSTFRGEQTLQIGAYFDSHVWPNRDALRRAAELTTWRNKGNLGRPSWWRGRGDVSAMEIRTGAERDVLRRHAMQRFGFDVGKPVVAVYNHAISDALGTNVEVFPDLAAWFERTVEFAAGRDDVNWLFVDHPSQDKYDATDFFTTLGEQYGEHRHLGFVPSWEISKNLMWSLVDLGVTVRGSISTELPAFAIPCIQAGWSEWSELGFSILAQDVDDYWRIIEDALDALKADRPLITEEQVEKARLWMWFYRSATDVPSVFLQQWEIGEADELFRTLRITMQYVEPDRDPVFESVRRMWIGKEPFLTRFDLTRLDPVDLELVTGPAGAGAGPDRQDAGRGPQLLTSFDTPVPSLALPGRLTRGDDRVLQVVDGFARGKAVIGRFLRSPGLVGIKVRPGPVDGRVGVSAGLTIDDGTAKWWEARAPADARAGGPDSARLLLVRSQGRDRTAVALDRTLRGSLHVTVSFELDPGELAADGLLVFELVGLQAGLPTWAADVLASHGLVGVQLDAVEVRTVDPDAKDGPERTGPTGAGHAEGRPIRASSGLFVVPSSIGARGSWRLRATMMAPPESVRTVGGPLQGWPSGVSRPPNAPAQIPPGRPLPDPEPDGWFRRWVTTWRSRWAAEARLDDRTPRQPTARALTSAPQSAGPGAPPRAGAPTEAGAAGRSLSPLADLLADLTREGRLRIRLVGLSTGTESAATVRFAGDDVLEVAAATSLPETVLGRVEVREDEGFVAPELRRYGVVWHLDEQPGLT